MENQDKRQTLTKKLNEYTGYLTAGQMTKLDRNEIRHYFNVYLNRDPHAGESDTIDEYKIYETHPDNKVLIKDLSTIKKRNDKIIKEEKDAQEQSINQGQGGPGDKFASALAQGATNTGQRLTTILGSITNNPNRSVAGSSVNIPTKTFSNLTQTMGNVGKDYRTDRHNNPTAMTTDVARNAGLKPGIDFVIGDPFRGGDGQIYHTAKLLGDPIATTIKAIDTAGFYTSGGKPRWTYASKIPNIQNWKNLTKEQKVAIVKQMYKFEGGSGKLIAQGGPTNGQGGPVENLGNITTRFGETTKDTDFHRGIDVANAQGTPISKLTGSGGIVTNVSKNGDYGLQAIIANDDGTKESYSHLSRALVRPGQRVLPNQQIANMGSSGNSWSATPGGDPSHLHFEISDKFHRLIDPLKYT